jgi:Sema domain
MLPQMELHIFIIAKSLLVCLLSNLVIASEPLERYTARYAPLHSIYYDKTENAIYVGGRDVLLKLDTNLNMIDAISMGPVQEDPTCRSYDECSNGTFIPNDIKIVKYSERNAQLFVCGTANKGACSLHSMKRIKQYKILTGVSTGHLVGSKRSVHVQLSTSSDSLTDDFLYVFHEYDERPERFSPPAVSLRKLDSSDYTLDYWIYDEVLHQISGLAIRPQLKQDYYMSFVYSFRFENHVYFLMNQQKSLDNKNDVIIRLGRVCYGERDPIFRSYIEMELFCQDRDVLYNKAVSATFMNNTLYIAAVKTKPSSREDIMQDKGTALFGFNISYLKNNFHESNLMCYFAGKGARLEWNGEKQQCKENNVGF